jgi:glutamyl-tRNA synthetase
MPDAPRVRFAPAPTGYLHLGSARSALFNWLFARHHGGTMVLRIEDTNAALATPAFYDAITEPLAWLGIDWDEGPIRQSDRTHLYSTPSNASSSPVPHTAATAPARPSMPATRPPVSRAATTGTAARVRSPKATESSFASRTPETGEVVIDDIVRGRVRFDVGELEDFVVRRGDGTPVFLVANAVDDADMAITHVIRGEDLLNTTPKVLLLWRALTDREPPTYAHLPLLVGADRKKLSKRKDSVALADFRAQGFLPEAMANHLALLGWGPPDDIEIRPMAEIIELFDLAAVNKSPAFFDMAKLEHINGHYIRALDTDALVDALGPWVGADAPWPAERFDPEVLRAVVPHIRERLRRLGDVVPLVDWLFTVEAPVETDDKETAKIAKAMTGDQVAAVLDAVVERFGSCDWTPEALAAVVAEVGDELGAKSQVPVRIAVTGRRVGPPLFEPMALMDRDLVIERLRAARASLD